jgi:hypothetical protein
MQVFLYMTIFRRLSMGRAKKRRLAIHTAARRDGTALFIPQKIFLDNWFGGW